MDPETGVVSTLQEFQEIEEDDLPFRININARYYDLYLMVTKEYINTKISDMELSYQMAFLA